jgi:hypothetical protein
MPFAEVAKMELPVGAQVIRCEGIDGHLWMWAIVDTEAPKEIRTFYLFKTGSKMPEDMKLRYLGCGAIFIQMELMLYIFEEEK